MQNLQSKTIMIKVIFIGVTIYSVEVYEPEFGNSIKINKPENMVRIVKIISPICLLLIYSM